MERGAYADGGARANGKMAAICGEAIRFRIKGTYRNMR